jgi:hypothetical protein
MVLTQENAILRCCSYGEVYSRTLAYNIGQLKPEVFSEKLVSSTGGNYLFNYMIRDKFVFRSFDEQLAAPVVGFGLHSRGDQYMSQSGRINNIVQPDFYESLVAGDTVTIQEFLIKYKKY